jgi:hypothetical protein
MASTRVMNRTLSFPVGLSRKILRAKIGHGAMFMAAFFAVALAVAPSSRAQSGEGGRIPPIEVGATYTAERSKLTDADCGCFWMQGGSAEADVYIIRGLSAAVDFTGTHAGNIVPGVDLSQISFMGGPRYTYGLTRWTRRMMRSERRTSVFGEALFGGVHAFDSAFPSSAGTKSSANAFSMQIGGGVNVHLARNFNLRAIEVDYVRTSLPNLTTDSQHDLRLAIGVTYRLHR